MTDLENFLDASGRDEKVREVRKKIDELGIEYVYFQFVSVTGRIMGKGSPSNHWERFAEKGFQLVYGSTANLFMDRGGSYIGYDSEAWELVGLPEPETFVQLPWDKRIARVFCTLFRGREHAENPGAYLTSDCRGNLRRIHEEFQNDHGMSLRAGTEPEMMWLTKDENGKPNGGYSNPYCYHIDQFESLRPVFMRVIEYGKQMGLDIIQGDHEDAPGQLEINWNYDDVMRNADRLTTYRQICAQVAREFGIIACFMSKPFMGVSANACHTNISLWKGGETEVRTFGIENVAGLEGAFTYADGGTNMFLPEGDNPRDPSVIGKHALGGMIRHQRGLTVLGASTVNSYRRLIETGFWAPIYASWGYQNRTTAIRVSAPDRFEYKTVDSMNNPYLLGAGLLKTMDAGIRNEIDPGPPEEGNIYDKLDKLKSEYINIPTSLGEAVQALREDEVVQSALPGEMYRVFEHYKRDEWERFLAQVTDWDVETYLDCLP